MFKLDNLDDELIMMSITLGKPNIRGHVYVADNFASVDLTSLLVVMDIPNDSAVDWERVIGKVDAVALGSDSVTVGWRLLDTPLGKATKILRETGCQMRLSPVGIGLVQTGGVISDYTLTCFALVPR
jgi:hypothetical protein